MFSVFLFLSPSTFFGLPLVQFLFLCLSLSLSLVLFFLSSFLSFFFCFLLVPSFSLFLIFLSSLLLFSEKNNTKCLNCNCFFINSFSFLWFPVLFFSFKSLFLIFVFPGIQLCFLLNINVLVSKNTSRKTPIFGQKGSCNKSFFLITYVLKNVKSYRFFPLFCQILVDVQKTL